MTTATNTAVVPDGWRTTMAALAQIVYTQNGNLHDDITALLETAKSLLAQPAAAPLSGWMPIETAPKDGTSIMLHATATTYQGEPVAERVTIGQWEEWTETASEYHATTGEYLGQSIQDGGASWMSWDGGFTEENPPTHWMPLPAAPGTEAAPVEQDAVREQLVTALQMVMQALYVTEADGSYRLAPTFDELVITDALAAAGAKA